MIVIRAPYMTLALDGTKILRNDNPKNIASFESNNSIRAQETHDAGRFHFKNGHFVEAIQAFKEST